MESDQQSLSLPAIASVVIAFLSVGSMLVLSLWPLALLGVVAAAFAIQQCRRYELLGGRWALAAMLLSLSTLVVAPVWHLHLYRSECAADHVRLDFAKVMRGPQPSIEKLVGQQVCLKGSAVPEKNIHGLKAFLFTVRGSNRVKNESVGVFLADGTEWDWSENPISVCGTLVIDPGVAPDDPATPRVRLIGATIRPAQTRFGLSDYSGDGC